MIKFNLEEKIIHHLILQSFFVKDLGLFHGKMGIVLLFFEYGKYTNCDIYTDVGEELLDNILNQLHENLPFHFDSGLSGIGWGIEYLLQNHFIEGNNNEICLEIDRKIMQINLRQLNNTTLETGLDGLYYYISARIRGAIFQNNSIPFNNAYLNDLSYVNSSFTINNLIKFYNRYPVSIKPFLNQVLIDEESYLSAPLGLRNGLSNYILTQLL